MAARGGHEARGDRWVQRGVEDQSGQAALVPDALRRQAFEPGQLDPQLAVVGADDQAVDAAAECREIEQPGIERTPPALTQRDLHPDRRPALPAAFDEFALAFKADGHVQCP